MKKICLVLYSLSSVSPLFAADKMSYATAEQSHFVTTKRSRSPEQPSPLREVKNIPEHKKSTFSSPYRSPRSRDSFERTSSASSSSRRRYLHHSDKKTTIRRAVLAQNTPERVASSKENHCNAPDSLYTRLENKLFQEVAPQLLNSQLTKVQEVTKKLHSKTKNKNLRNKSIIAASFALLEIETGSVVGSFPIDSEFYWSSKKDFPKANLVGLATPVCLEGQQPLNQNHSERNFFSHLHEDFRGLLEKASFSFDTFNPELHIFAVVLGNSYSSCPVCSRFLGGENEKSTSLADQIAEDLQGQEELQSFVEADVPFYVLIFHQGLSSHSKMRCKPRSSSTSSEASASSLEDDDTTGDFSSLISQTIPHSERVEVASNKSKKEYSIPEIRPSQSMRERPWNKLRNTLSFFKRLNAAAESSKKASAATAESEFCGGFGGAGTRIEGGGAKVSIGTASGEKALGSNPFLPFATDQSED